MAGISNNEIRTVKSLQLKKFRDEYGLFFVEGEKMYEEALKSGFRVEKVYFKDEIGEEAMSRISALHSPSPVLAVLEQRSPEAFRLPSKGLYLGLDNISDPGNLGTILRLADWFGADGILASRPTVELYNPKVVQASMGAIFRVKFSYCDLPSVCGEFSSAGGKVYGTFLEGENIYTHILETGTDAPVIVIIGNESNGISPEVEGTVSDRLHIPSFGDNGSESLNAAIATAITLSEFRRR